MKIAAIVSVCLSVVFFFFGIRFILNLPEVAQDDVVGNVAGALIPGIFCLAMAGMFWMKSREAK